MIVTDIRYLVILGLTINNTPIVRNLSVTDGAMRHVPQDIADYYRRVLKENVPQILHYSYVKWIRYYLDFCAKYRFTE